MHLSDRELHTVRSYRYFGPKSLIAPYWSLLLARSITEPDVDDALRRSAEIDNRENPGLTYGDL